MDTFIPELIELATCIQQIPAPTFQEAQRAEFVRGMFASEGLSQVATDPAGNVFACLPGSPAETARQAPPLVISAHLDTVFPGSTDLALRTDQDSLHGAGIGDNSVGVAGLFGLLWMLRREAVCLPFDLWLVANTAEEGLGDLRGMKAVVERFSANVQAYLVLEGIALGQVFHRALGVRRYRISVKTGGGHSWIDHGRPSAVHELTSLSTRIIRLDLPQAPRTTLNIGVIAGGTSVNTIAAQANLELDLRSEGMPALEDLSQRVEQVCRQSEREGVQVSVEVIGSRPAGEIPASHPLVSLAGACLRAEGIEPKLSIGSTDANIPLSRGIPALTLGLTTGGGAHTLREHIHIEPLKKGMAVLLGVVQGLSHSS